MSTRLGISGAIARRFQDSEITPLLALVGLLMGLFAVLVTPREEEPQIDVTFANVFIPFPGASAREVEHLVTTPAEQVMSEIAGVKHVYSVSRPGMAILTVRFKVGEAREKAIVRLYNAVFSHEDWLPQGVGVGRPIIKPKGIDDVPIVAGTLWSEDPRIGAHELARIAHAIEAELKRVPGTRDIYTIGAPDRVVHVLLDPQRMAGYGIALSDLRAALALANTSAEAGGLVRDNAEVAVQAGLFLSQPEEVGELVVGVHEGRPVYLRDVAEIRYGPDQPERYVRFGTGAAAAQRGLAPGREYPAVTIAVAKKPGTNAVDIAERLIERFEQLKGTFVPEGVHATVTRNYGATAEDKAMTLIKKLVFATVTVVLLVLFTLGWREALVVGTAVVVTLAVTLFASWAWGFTLNRVSLFALIFSIGILVDDAIVVVENIHRHVAMGEGSLLEAIPRAVDEVGGPTILATLTVVAALLPMAFVTGLMGPYMSPIPINASTGMLISLAVAFVVTPWLMHEVLRRRQRRAGAAGGAGHAGEAVPPRLQRLFARLMGPFLRGREGRWARRALSAAVVVLIAAAAALPATGHVILKMLPFDNKSEFQVVLDMPEGTPVERTAAVLGEMARYLATVPEVTDYQIYAGTAAPINFNGLVRQYYLRQAPHLGDIQVNLVDKHRRSRKSHEIARAVRPRLVEIARRHGGAVKVVEVPPGPPVLSPLVAEVYGLDYEGQIEVARRLREVFEQTPDVVDVDDSTEAPAPKLVLRVDRQKAALLGLAQADVVAAVRAALGGEDAAYLHDETAKYPIPVRMELPVKDKADLQGVLAMRLRARGGALVPLSEVVEVAEVRREQPIYHKDLLPVVYVVGDVAGAIDSPLYGMFRMVLRLAREGLGGFRELPQFFVGQPDDPYRYSVKWDGEWQVTYETFRDMGIAYSVGLVLIYLLVVGQFRSYLVPLVIMAPIPLTIVGVMPGHALLGREFTATSMIGMIALAGIIVRNSILLVDFVNDEAARGVPFDEAVIRAAAVRARPIALTALAAMLGAFFILDDPIFSGLAVSLIFGIFVSTVLTLVVIPVLYYAVRHRRMG
ncbi:efflux RND transporter permease subunit [Inmirania thermothiophila]|uniref:Multidrug efflux pump subunit AcrB n=1 Tax=Inmirania thermothiophila TaxID=1750597 RepID=A0A3N1XT28_9GAMM|nr:efflux RND transporter permease subunit [Inmirania thermothiophila]ROR29814.1 multidrug efflux pump subunit AcrB [Inmirania thermothiophila]